MAMATATRLLLRSVRRPPLRQPASPAGLPRHGSPLPPPIPYIEDVVQRLHTLPRALLSNKFRWFVGGGSRQFSSSSSSKAVPPGRNIIKNMLSASFVSTSAAALLDLEDMKSRHTSPHSVCDSGAAATLLYWKDGDEDNPPKRPRVEREKRRVTDALIALHLLVHGADVLTNRKLNMWGTKNNELIRKGQIWRLATSSVLHVGFIHIALNMLFMKNIGPTMEEINGPGRFLAIYCASALADVFFFFMCFANVRLFTPGNSVGASDALYGLIGAQGVYTWRRRESLTSSMDTFKEIRDMILFGLAFSFALRCIKIRIDDWAHLGGFLGGAVVQCLLGPPEKQHVARVGTAVFEERVPALFH